MKNKKLALFFIMNSILILTIIINSYSATSNIFTFWTKYHKTRISTKESFKTWNTNGITICSYNESQSNPQICSDSAGGAIIVWEDLRSGGPSHIYAQKINSTGGVEWKLNGTRICTDSTNQDYPQICSDGSGGVIITWRDDRSGHTDIYAQRINSSGGIEWNASGVKICNYTANHNSPKICSDFTGGAIIAWYDDRNGNNDIFTQRINADGIVQWTPNGVEICTANETQYQLQICSDNASGAIITWEDHRSGTTWDIYAQRINSSGGIEWPVNGTVICAENDDQKNPQICNDGEGGTIITWQDKRMTPDVDIYAQKINSSGGLKWSSIGHAICISNDVQYNPQLCSDGAGGAIITWRDFRNGSNYDIYAQRVKSAGGVTWTTNGVPICKAINDQESPQICSDGADGAIITWQDYRNGSYFDIYAQKIDSGGSIEWTPNGIVICQENDSQEYPQLCSDGNGGAIITWQDYRSGSNYDIYAQRVIKFAPADMLDLIMLLLASQTPPVNRFFLLMIIGVAAVIGIIIIVIIVKKKK